RCPERHPLFAQQLDRGRRDLRAAPAARAAAEWRPAQREPDRRSHDDRQFRAHRGGPQGERRQLQRDSGAGPAGAHGARPMRRLAGALLVIRAAALAAQTPATWPTPVEGDFVARNFSFASGESLPELRLHYTTIGTPARDAGGRVSNAVLIMHGTGGSGRGFLSQSFAGRLFGPGQLLDATKFFIILPDGIGHGKSSKPSDGMHMKFPKYTYDDMVKAQYLLVTEGLKVDHLRLVMGTSMGAMHTWVWGYSHPDFMDALMPLASNPVEIAGRN